MIGKTAIIIATHNRKSIVRSSLPALGLARDAAIVRGHLQSADIFIYDDGSDEYDQAWLQSVSPDATVVCLPKQHQNATSSVSLLRSRAFQDTMDSGDYKFFLHTDSDMIFDIDAFGQIERLMASCPHWGVIGLFNPSLWDWESKSKESGPDWYMHSFCGGTMFLRRPEVNVIIPRRVKDYPAWDGYYSKLMGHNRACISRTSYVEHIGGGIHRPNPARNPTGWLNGLSLEYGTTRTGTYTDSHQEGTRNIPSGQISPA